MAATFGGGLTPADLGRMSKDQLLAAGGTEGMGPYGPSILFTGDNGKDKWSVSLSALKNTSSSGSSSGSSSSGGSAPAATAPAAAASAAPAAPATPASVAGINKVVTPEAPKTDQPAMPASVAGMGGGGDVPGGAGMLGSPTGSLRALGRRMFPMDSNVLTGRRTY